MTIATTLFLLSIAASPAVAQQSAVDPRWTPWLGCWELVDENVREGEVDPAELADGGGTRRSRSTGAQVCVNPADQGSGVTLSTIVNRQAALEETVIADGKDHPIVEAECKGSQRTEWSRTGQRLFARAEIACNGQPSRVVSGLALIADGPTWVDIQVIDSLGAKSIRVRKYRRAFDQTHARSAASPVTPGGTAAQTLRVPSPFTLDDVKEASAKLPAETIEAALVELNTSYSLDKKRLIELDEAGVADSVIDVMVALAYPKRFEIQRPSSRASSGYGGLGGYGGYGGYGLAWPFGLYDAEFGPAYYSPYGYSYWGQYDPRYYQYSGFVPVEGGSGGGGGGGSIEPSGNGRVVDGRGYTRVTTRAPEGSINGRQNTGDNGGYSTTSAGGSSNSGGSSGVSSSGYSGGGGGSSSGGGERTAQPRPPGGK